MAFVKEQMQEGAIFWFYILDQGNLFLMQVLASGAHARACSPCGHLGLDGGADIQPKIIAKCRPAFISNAATVLVVARHLYASRFRSLVEKLPCKQERQVFMLDLMYHQTCTETYLCIVRLIHRGSCIV